MAGLPAGSAGFSVSPLHPGDPNKHRGLAAAPASGHIPARPDGLQRPHLRAPTPTPLPHTVTGGGLSGELSDWDLDARMTPSFPNYVPALRFYRVRTEGDPVLRRGLAEALVEQLHAILDRHPCAIMPVHVRHHWTTAVVRRVQDRLVTVIHDSARHPATARDMELHFSRDLCLEPPTIVAHAKQRRGSAECGLHVFLIGIWSVFGTRPLPREQLTPPRYLSLHAWRALLDDGQPLTRTLAATLVNSSEDVASLIGFVGAVRGGARRGGPSKSVRIGPSTSRCHLRYSITVPDKPQPPVPKDASLRPTHSARAQRAAAASFDPSELADAFVDQTPVPLSWFLSRAAISPLSDTKVELVRSFYLHCDPAGGFGLRSASLGLPPSRPTRLSGAGGLPTTISGMIGPSGASSGNAR